MEDMDYTSLFIVPKQTGADSPVPIAKRLMKECEEFSHLQEGEARFAFLLSATEVNRHGKQVLGAVHLPVVQGQLRSMFEWLVNLKFGFNPDFIVILDQAFWNAAEPIQREILVYHELRHCIHKTDRDGEPRWTEDGRPVFGLIAHDVEEFADTVRRYGAYSEDIQEFIEAIAEGEENKARRRQQAEQSSQ
jgi:hypothetical protein